MDNPTLSIHNLGFDRNDEILFQKLNYTLASGDLLQIRGKNGSGKSTLLRIIAGLIQPTEGSVSHSQQLNYLGHQNSIKHHLTVSENLKLHSALNKHSLTRAAIKNALEQVNLSSLIDTPAQHLSAGQAKRLSLAKLLLNPTQLWLLDEPLTTLDNEGQAYLMTLLKQHLIQQGIAMIATHQDLTIDMPVKTLWLGE
jgi:heme exporter protein A